MFRDVPILRSPHSHPPLSGTRRSALSRSPNGLRYGCLCLALCCCTGCQMLSQAAYRCGDFLDPHHVACHDPIGDCPVCGQYRPSPGAPLPEGQQCDHCQAMGGGDGGAVFAGGVPPAGPDLADIRATTNELQHQMNIVSGELTSRNDELVQTRAEFAQVQAEVASVRQDMNLWQHQMVDLRDQLRKREQQRLAALNDLTEQVGQLLHQVERR